MAFMSEELESNSPAIWVLRVAGLWYPQKRTKYYYIYKIYSIVQFFMYIVHLTPMIIHVCRIYRDIEAFSASIYVLSIKLIGVYKVIYLLKGMTFSQELIHTLDQEIFQPKDLRQAIIKKSLFSGWKNRSYILLFGVLNTVLFLDISPFIDGISKKRLPFAAWYPFNYKISPFFEVIFLYQIWGSVYAGCINVGADIFASQILTNITIQCTLLSDTLENLDKYCRTKQDMNGLLKKCISHHKAILRYSKAAETLFNLGVFAQFSASSLIMCMNLLQMSWLNPGGELLALLVYQIAILMTLLTYCWHGNEVIFSSSQIPISAYNCQWLECNKEFKKNLLIFMHKTQTPIVIRTINFFIVSSQIFITIIRSSYSFYAVLRSVHET